MGNRVYKDITTLGHSSLDEGSNVVAFYHYLHVKWNHNKRNYILKTTMHHQKNQEPVYWKRTFIFPVQEEEAKKTYTVASDSLCIGNIYLLLAEFSVRTVNYGPSFFPLIYGPSAKRAGHKSMKKKRIRNLQYGPKKRG